MLGIYLDGTGVKPESTRAHLDELEPIIWSAPRASHKTPKRNQANNFEDSPFKVHFIHTWQVISQHRVESITKRTLTPVVPGVGVRFMTAKLAQNVRTKLFDDIERLVVETDHQQEKAGGSPAVEAMLCGFILEGETLSFAPAVEQKTVEQDWFYKL